jgi:hypothetical protein
MSDLVILMAEKNSVLSPPEVVAEVEVAAVNRECKESIYLLCIPKQLKIRKYTLE